MGLIKRLTYQWIGNQRKNTIKFIFSFVLGVSDYVLDILVLIDFFHHGHNGWGSIMLICIFLGGIASVVYRYVHINSNSDQFSYFNYFELILDFFGLAFILEFFRILSKKEFRVTEEFLYVRIIESVCEALPSGAFQIYILVTEEEYGEWLNVLSVLTSVLGFSFGILSLHVTDEIVFGNQNPISRFSKMEWSGWFSFWGWLSCDFLLRAAAPSLLLTMDQLEDSSPKVWIPICFFIVSYLILVFALFPFDKNDIYESLALVLIGFVVVAPISFLSIFSAAPLILMTEILGYDWNEPKNNDYVFRDDLEYFLRSFFNSVCFVFYFMFNFDDVDIILLIIVCVSTITGMFAFYQLKRPSDTDLEKLERDRVAVLEFAAENNLDEVLKFIQDGNDLEIRDDE